MKKYVLSILAVFLLAALFAFPSSAAEIDGNAARSSGYDLDYTVYGTYDYAEAQKVLKIVNEERTAEGLSSLTLDPTLTEMAMQRAAECAAYFSHTRPDGSDWSSIVQANSSYLIGSYAENIAAGQTSASSVMTSWMNSTGHHDNIMKSAYTSIGIGCFYQDDGKMFWVQLFHSKTVNTGSIPSTAKQMDSIVIHANTDYCGLYLEDKYLCQIEIYQDCTIYPHFYLKDSTTKSKLYISGGYQLVSMDTSIASTTGTTITGVSPGQVYIRLYFGSVYYLFDFMILRCPQLSYTYNAGGQPVIVLDQFVSSFNFYVPYVYCKEANDTMWTMLATADFYEPGYVDSYSFPGDVYTYVLRYRDPNYGWVEVSNRLVVTTPLSTPSVTASNVASTGKIKLSWDAVNKAAKYKVYRATSKNGTYKLLTTTTDTSIVNTKAEAGKTYYYKVVAVSASGLTSQSSAAVGRCCDLPRPVVTVSNISSSGKNRITWNAVEGATKYTLYIYDAEGNQIKSVTTTGTAMTHSSAVPGTTYTYKVRALCDVSAATSASSSSKSRCCDLAQPTIKVSNVASSGKNRITWGKVSGATGYKVYIYDAAGNLLKTASVTGTAVTHSGAVPGEAYTYKVRATCGISAATSDYSAGKTRICVLARPTVSITLNSVGKPKLSWKAVNGAEKYKVYRSTDGETWTLLKTTTGTTITNSKAVSGTTYYYRVIAIHANSSANSAYSSVVSVKSK